MSLRIALVHVADQGGGAERSVLTLHQSLSEQGHDCRLFVGTKSLDEPNVIEIHQDRPIPGLLRVTRYLERKGFQNLYAPWFRNLPNVIGQADVVHLHSLWKVRHGFADLNGIRAIAKQYPTVMTLRDSWTMTGHCACPIGCDRWLTGCGKCPDLVRAPAIEKDYTHLNWKRKRKTIQRSDLHVTAISTWLKQQIEQSPIFAGKTIHVVHNSISSDSFCPGDMHAARRELQIAAKPFVVLLAGQSIEGVHRDVSQHAVKALNQLGDHNIHAMLVGRSAMDVANTLRTPSTVVPFRQTSEEMALCYQAADLTIVPSEYETFGRVAAESLFCGTPVLAFATGGLTDIVTEGVCGKLVPSGDVSAMADAIAELKASPETLAGFRSRCVDHVRSRFSTGKIADQYADVYRQVIAERGQCSATAGTPDLDRAPTSQCSATPKISCIIPAYNCSPWLERAVESVLQTGYPSLEVIVVDDGSTDETLQVARDLEAAHGQSVRVVQHPDGGNRGVSASRNIGLQESTGQWICFLDADDYVYPHRFESAVEILSADPDIDGVHQLAEMVFPTEETSQRWWSDSPYFGFEQSVQPADLLHQLLQGKCWATSAIVFRKSLLERTGLFNEQLQIAEDCHLWFRMAAVGKLVSGDLSRPVSAYWRRIDSAYQPSPYQRLQMIRSMTSFLNWLRSAKLAPGILREASTTVQQYILNGLTNARFEKKRKLAWSIAWQGVRGLPSLTVDPRFCGQVARLAAGR